MRTAISRTERATVADDSTFDMYHFVADRTPEPLVLSERVQVPGHICQYLKSFQVDALFFLHKHFANREFCVLNDESGLGKSVVTCVFLSAIAKNKTSLIVVQNDDELVTSWQFNFNVLTSLKVSVLEAGQDLAGALPNVIIAKWATMRTVDDLSKQKFDYIIIDNRGQMLNNNFCTSMLHHNYERNVNLIISSIDITSDEKLMYNVLRLGGRLDRQFESFRAFEEKYKLPDLRNFLSKKANLEDYFLKRKMLSDYCKDFRLRRYRHQYDEHLPLVSPERYKINLELWRTASHSGNGSQRLSEHMNGTSAPSDTATEELFLQALALNKAITQTIETRPNQQEEPEIIDICDEPILMSPLVLDSGSDLDAEDDCEVGVSEKSNEYRLSMKDNAETIKEIERSAKSTNNARKGEISVNAYQNDVYEFVDLSSECIEQYGNQENKQRHIQKHKTAEISILEKCIQSKSDDSCKSIVPEKSENRKLSKKENSECASKGKVKYSPKDVKNKNDESNVNACRRITRLRNAENTVKMIHHNFRTKTPKARCLSTEKSSILLKNKKQKRTENKAIVETGRLLRSKHDNVKEFEKKKQLDNSKITHKVCEPKEPPKTPDVQNKLPTKYSKMKTCNTLDLTGARNTRSMQRLTRSSDISRNKYMLNLTLITDRKQRRRKRATPKSNAEASKSHDTQKNARVEEKTEESSEFSNAEKRRNAKMPNNKSAATDTGTAQPSQALILSLTECDEIPCGQKLASVANVEYGKQDSFLMPPTQRTTQNTQLKHLLFTANCLSESDVVIAPSGSNRSQNVIVLSSSTDDGSLSSQSTQSRRTRALKQKKSTQGAGGVSENAKQPSFGELPSKRQQECHKSPDIFSASTDLGLLCTQSANKTSTFEGFKIFGSEVKQLQQQHAVSTSKQTVPLSRKRSCLDILEKIFEPNNKNRKSPTQGTLTTHTSKKAVRNQSSVVPSTVLNGSLKATQPRTGSKTSKRTECGIGRSRELIEEELFEITNNDTIGSVMRINSNGEVSPVQPVRSTQNGQHNKITNYLIGMTQLPTAEAEESMHGNSTPNKKTQLSGTATIRKSPKSRSTQATKLTKWFSKNDGLNEWNRADDTAMTNTQLEPKSTRRSTAARRRRLELSFKN